MSLVHAHPLTKHQGKGDLHAGKEMLHPRALPPDLLRAASSHEHRPLRETGRWLHSQEEVIPLCHPMKASTQLLFHLTPMLTSMSDTWLALS